MRNLFKLVLSFLFFWFAPMQILSQQVLPPSQNPEASFTFLLPVNVFEGQNINLRIKIPSNFKAIDQPPPPITSLMEFIPYTDNSPLQWTEMITIAPIMGKKLPASKYMKNMIEGMRAKTNFVILESKETKYDLYEESYLIGTYTFNFRNEIVLFYAASGPYDLATAQYAILLKNPGDLNPAVDKLKAFLINQLKIL